MAEKRDIGDAGGVFSDRIFENILSRAGYSETDFRLMPDKERSFLFEATKRLWLIREVGTSVQQDDEKLKPYHQDMAAVVDETRRSVDSYNGSGWFETSVQGVNEMLHTKDREGLTAKGSKVLDAVGGYCRLFFDSQGNVSAAARNIYGEGLRTPVNTREEKVELLRDSQKGFEGVLENIRDLKTSE